MDEDNVETYSLIWLDSLANSSEEKLNIQRELRSSINYLKRFTNENECEDYIRSSTTTDDRILLILSGQFGRDFIPHIHQLRQISSIYIFCLDKKKYETWINQYTKIKCLITDLDELVCQIRYDQSRRNHIKIDEPLSISILNEKKNEEKLIFSIDNEFVYSQLLINCLIQMKSISQSKRQLINLCKIEYKENESELLIIDEFEKDYLSCKCLWWLTRDSFLFRLINKSIRLKNYKILFLLTFIFNDIYQKTKENQLLKCVHVYRSLLITNKEFKILENSLGKLISINTFLFTNLIRKQSIAFFKESIPTNDLHRVLLEIDTNTNLINIKPFANITSFSYSNGEQQILFMCGSIFRITNIHYDQKDQINIIQMKLCNYDEQELKLIPNFEEFDLFSFGELLIDMKKFNQAQIYFQYLIHQFHHSYSNLSICYDKLANIFLEKGQYDLSLKSYQKCLEIKIKKLNENDSSIASIHKNIAFIYLKKNDSKQALQSYHMALNILQQHFGDEHSNVAQSFNNIALIYKNEKKYEEALHFYKKSSSIYQKSLPINHPDLALSYTNIGCIYSHLNQYDLALEHFNQALNIYQNILPQKHSLISLILENIANIYSDKQQLDQGLNYYQKAASIYRHLLPSTHPDVLQIEIIIKRIQSKKKKSN